jgi:hypothetical protein
MNDARILKNEAVEPDKELKLRPKGGRGYKAPYETKMFRVPVPLHSQVSKLVDRYQNFVLDGGDATNPPELLDIQALELVNNLIDENRKLKEKLNKALAKTDESQAIKPVYKFQEKLEEVRDRVLNKLKVGRQSTAGKAIDTFIREMKR